MANIYTIRRFELLLVVTATVAQRLNNLFHDARYFDQLVADARRGGISAQTILQYLRNYDHTANHNMPIIGSTIMFLIAWGIFHILFFPRIKGGKFQAPEYALLALVAGLIVGGSLVLNTTVLVSPRPLNTSSRMFYLTFMDLSSYKRIFVLSVSLGMFTLLYLYELLSQLYYKLYAALEMEPNGRTLNYTLGLVVSVWFFVMMLSQSDGARILVRDDYRQLLALILFGLTVYHLQAYCFRKYFKRLHSKSSTVFSLNPGIGYFLLLVLGDLMFTALSPDPFFRFLPIQILTIIVLFSLSVGIAYFRIRGQKEKIELATEVFNKSAELTSLQSQINPHFLFNALNSLYATALMEKGEKTADGIQKLGDMMRFMLHENNPDRIQLSSEIAYLRNYIDIQRMRLDETQNIDIRVNIQEVDNTVFIAPMLLSPFIENASSMASAFRSRPGSLSP
jgi:two-component system LytT family sensor kinase